MNGPLSLASLSGMYPTSVHSVGVYLIDVPLIGVHLMMRLSWRASHRRVSH